jgi:hypothetical protein
MEVFEIVADSVSTYGKPAGYFVAGALVLVKIVIPWIKTKPWKKGK